MERNTFIVFALGENEFDAERNAREYVDKNNLGGKICVTRLLLGAGWFAYFRADVQSNVHEAFFADAAKRVEPLIRKYNLSDDDVRAIKCGALRDMWGIVFAKEAADA